MASKLTLLAALLLSACSGSLIDHNGFLATTCPQTVSACGLTCSACPIISNSQVSCLNSNCNYTSPDGGSDCALPSLAYPSGCATPASVAAGGDTTCAIVGGAVECWGVLPQGGKSALPVAIAGLTSATEIAVGGGHACAVQNHQVLCWGANESGQTGQPASAVVTVPTVVAGVDPSSSLTAGGHHTCIIVSGGGVSCWGNNDSNQLGDTGASRNTPQLVAGTSGAASVSAGSAHTCMGTAGGASCWGAGAQGQIGNGSTASASSPKAATFKGGGGTVPALALAAGEQHNCAIVNGEVQCWGAGGQGQLGDGTIGNQSLPQKLNLVNATGVAAGGSHSCAFGPGGVVTGEDGSATPAGLLCWGSNDSGQLGTGALSPSLLAAPSTNAVSLAELPSVVAAGTSHTCALLVHGALLCWGNNGNGQLGINSAQTIIASPTQIASAAR